MLKSAHAGAVFLLNAPFPKDEVLGPAARFKEAGADHQQEAEVLRDRRLHTSLNETGMGGRINTIMQTCFFAISGVSAA